ncbi:glycosyltransferase family 2 protein [Streptomyces rimosus]|uniref:glycosyltransferase family 2 protein n=1 Tax=Streptomyces rimosus TaxID=1927 RepID=UPI00067C552A|nr:glycosyltransferase family 2 protein [Streptomyces rimosus]
MPATRTTAQLPARATRPLVSVVVPCFDEAAVIGETHRRLSAVLRGLPECEYEVVYVDDGSGDATWDRLTELAADDARVRLVRLTRNFGHQPAVLAGLREAAGDAVVTIDADLQDPPGLIADMVERWRAGWAVVSARRTGREGESRFKTGTAHVFYRLLAAVADHPVNLDTGDFRLLDREVVRTLSLLPESELYLRGSVCWAGFPETSLEYGRLPRLAGRTKYTLRKMAGLSRRGLLACSSAPARVPAVVGLAWLGGTATASAVRGRPLPLAAWTFGCEAVLLGLLGEYLLLVHREVRGRPPYVVRQRWAAGVPTPVEVVPVEMAEHSKAWAAGSAR